MYELARLDLKSLDPTLAKSFKKFIEPNLYPCLSDMDPYGVSNTKIVVIGAFDQGNPIGIAIASIKKFIHFVDIYSLFVHPDYRNQKLGTRLFSMLQDELKREKASTVTLNYPLGEKTTLAFEKILLANGWVNTRPFMIKCIFNRDKFPRPWIKKPLIYPKGFQEFPWKEITKAEKDALKSMENQHIFPHAVSPFIKEDKIEPMNSLGLRHNGEVIGWIITHRISQDTVKYSSFFIKRGYRHQGYAIKLLVSSIERQLQSPVLYASIEIPLTLVDNSWIKFINRRLLPNATHVTYVNQAWRRL